jgi:hypothetical protein
MQSAIERWIKTQVPASELTVPRSAGSPTSKCRGKNSRR